MQELCGMSIAVIRCAEMSRLSYHTTKLGYLLEPEDRRLTRVHSAPTSEKVIKYAKDCAGDRDVRN